MPDLLSASASATSSSPRQEWYSVDQLEVISDISKWTWRRWAQLGVISSAKVSSRLLISRSEYERIMRESTRPRVIAKESPRKGKREQAARDASPR